MLGGVGMINSQCPVLLSQEDVHVHSTLGFHTVKLMREEDWVVVGRLSSL